ncbi:MAG: phage portal protein [Oscillospiraceae bacterium]
MKKIKLWDWFLDCFDRQGRLNLDVIENHLAIEPFFKVLAVNSCTRLIANTISKCEFKTYEKGIETRKDNYYLFNVEPNPNLSASQFWYKLVLNLLENSECLVVMINEKYYIADSFERKKYTIKENVYSDIVIDNYVVPKSYNESEVMYFEFNNKESIACIDGIYADYAKLIAVAEKGFKRGYQQKGKLNVPINYPATAKADEDLTNLLEIKMKRFFNADSDAVLPLTNGLDYDECSKDGSTKGGRRGQDIRAFIDDIFDYVAMSYDVPSKLLKGDVADTGNAVNDFVTFCINPFVKRIADEINRKVYKKEDYLKRTYMKIDTTNIRSVDIKDVAGSLDILMRIGAYNVDECLEHLGMEPLGTQWSKTRFITKNYMPIEKMVEGGEK